MNASGLSLLLVTVPDQKTAELIARTLVTEKLAACVSSVPGLTSTYIWEGKLENSSELLLLIKTSSENWALIEKRITELHPYTCPEIVSLSIKEASESYLKWVLEGSAKEL